MMERTRDARRGTMDASFNGGSMSRRRQQRTNTTSSSLRDSPEDDVGAMELQETSTGRLRDRKRERDRERSGGRSGSAKRRRPGERIMHVSSREDLEDSSEESVDDDDEDEPATGVMRFPPPNSSSSHAPPPLSGPISSASSLAVNPSSGSSLPPPNNRHRKTLPSKNARVQSLWRVTDDMVVPRKARSVSTSRRVATESHECWDSGAGAGGGGGSSGVSGSGDQIPNTHHRQTSSSPTRNNQTTVSTTTPISLRKKTLKPISGVKHHRLPKVAKSVSSVQDIEFEVAEVLFGMTRQQFQSPPTPSTQQQTDTHKSDGKDYPVACVSTSPPHHSNTPSNVLVPKRKRPRPVSNSSEEGFRSKMEYEGSPKLEKNSITNTMESDDGHPKKESTRPDRTLSLAVPTVADADSKENKEVAIKKCSEGADVSPKKPHNGEKLKIDLMVTPHAVKSSVLADDILMESNSDDMGKTSAIAKMEEERRPDKGTKLESKESHEEATKITMTVEKFDTTTSLQEFKPKERNLDLQLDLEKPHLEAIHNQHITKLPKTEKGQQPTTVPLQMGVAGWSGGLPPLGYMGQMSSSLPPGAFSLDGNGNGSSKAVPLPPQFPSQQLRLKRCATHNYIAKNIYYHQQISRIGPMWAATAAPPPPLGAIPLLGAKPPPPYNLNSVPPSEFMGFPGRSLGLMPDKPGQTLKDSKNATGNNFKDAQTQRKPHGISQPPQGPSSSSNMMPAFIFPINQQQQTGSRSVSKTPVTGTCNTVTSINSSSTTTVPSGTTSVTNSMNVNEAQYLAILQNNGYSFPIPSQVGSAPQYRASHGQAMPFFNGPFYASQMLHHPLQQQHAQSGGPQNMNNSIGPLPTSQKQQQHVQPRMMPTGSATGGLPPTSKPRPQQQQHMTHHLTWQLNGDSAADEHSSAESRGSQLQQHHVQKGGGGMYSPNVPFHPQDYANMMPHVTATSGGGGGGDKHHLSTSQTQNMKIDPTQSSEFAMSFATFNGSSAPSGVSPPGIDFSALGQNHLFSTSEASRHSTRHGYQMSPAAGSSQHKKTHTEDSKSCDLLVQGDDERKAIAKPPGGFSHQHSLSFSRSDDPQSTIMNNSAVAGENSRTLNLIPAAASTTSNNGYRPSVTSVASSTNVNNYNLQQQHVLQMQRIRKQQQQQPPPRVKPISSNTGVFPDRTGSVATKFPNSSMAAHFTPGANTQPSSQWKSSSTQPQPTIVAKNHVVQQQTRQPTQQLPGHQMQISFTSNPQKSSPSNPSTASPINSITGSHQASSASKAAGGGSPRASSGGSKPGVGSSASSTLPLQQQHPSSKGSQSGTTRKSSSPVSNRNIPSILGNPHMASTGSKNQQPLLPPHPHQQNQHPFSQPYLLFSNPAYLQQVQNPSVNALAAGYYQRWPLEQQQQQPNSTSGSTATSDPAKAVAAAASANNMKGSPQPNLLHSAQLVAAAGQQQGSHPLMSGFPYIQTVPSMPAVKQVDQKTHSGNDTNNVQACWQSEKR